MENTNEKIVLKTSESQRAANKKYRDKMKENQAGIFFFPRNDRFSR